jgi:hypothetical protein
LPSRPAVGAQTDFLDLLAARQRQEDGAAAFADFVDRRRLHSVGGQPIEGRLVAIGGKHLEAALANQIAAHRFTHGADADKSDHVRHVSPL